MKKINKLFQKGFTLVEILIVIAIAGVILAAVGPKIAEAFRENKATDEADNVTRLFGKLSSRFSQDGFDNISNQVAIDNGAVPDDMINSTGIIINEYRTPITITPTSRLGGTDNFISIQSIGYPSAVCATIIGNSQRNFSEITVNGTAVKNVGDTSIDRTALGTACQSSPTATVVYVGQ